MSVSPRCCPIQDQDEVELSVISPADIDRSSAEANRLIRYSLQLAMLSKLLGNQLISQAEYTEIRQKLMNKYGILSEITIPSVYQNDI